MSTTQLITWIRHAVLADIPSLATIDADAYTHPLPVHEWRRMLVKERHLTTLVAEFDNAVLGYCHYMLTHDAIWVERMAVWSGVRRQGLGRQLLRTLQARIDKGSRRTLRTLVSEEEPDVAEFFRACRWRMSRLYRPLEPSDGVYGVAEYRYRGRDVAAEVLDSIMCRDGRVVR